MTRLFSAIGIDYQQWKALTVVALKNDFRSTSLGQRMDSREVRVVFSLLFQAVFYTMFGTMIAYVVWASRDPWLTGTIASTYIAFIVGTAVVLDHHSVISSPVDYAVLGFRPVSSRTYFAVKLTNILVYTTALTTVAAWVPLLVALVRHGWGISAALMLDIYASSTATTLAIALGYATVLRAVGPDAIERVLSYVADDHELRGIRRSVPDLRRSLAITPWQLGDAGDAVAAASGRGRGSAATWRSLMDSCPSGCSRRRLLLSPRSLSWRPGWAGACRWTTQNVLAR